MNSLNKNNHNIYSHNDYRKRNRTSKQSNSSMTMGQPSMVTALLSSILASQAVLLVDGFSMVAPPTVNQSLRKTLQQQQQHQKLPAEWITSTYNPIPIAEPDESLLLSSSTMPAVSSPLFGGAYRPKTRSMLPIRKQNERVQSELERKKKENLTTYEELKARFLKDMTIFVVEELEKTQATKERNSLLSTIREETNVFHKTVQETTTVQENLQFVWDAAGDAVMEFGLLSSINTSDNDDSRHDHQDALPLPLPSTTKQTGGDNDLLQLFASSNENLFDQIKYSHVQKKIGKEGSTKHGSPKPL